MEQILSIKNYNKKIENEEQLSIFDQWKEYCIEDKDYYLNWGSGQINEALKGTKPGTSIFIGAQPNFGKPLKYDTLVTMSDGTYKQIKDIQVGDFVVTGKCRSRKVLRVFEQGSLPILKITTKLGRVIYSAYNHSFYVFRYCENYKHPHNDPLNWVQAKDLRIKDRLELITLDMWSRSKNKVDDFEFPTFGYIGYEYITGIQEDGYAECFCLEVEEDHTFLANDVIVHNSQLMTSMMINLLKNNEDVTILDFTLDDPTNKRITQYVAGLANVEMNLVDYANKIVKPEDTQRFKDGCEMFRHWMSNGSMYLYESSNKDGDNQAQIGFISKTVQEVRKKIGDRKLVIVIDAINDVDNSKVKIEDNYARSESVSKELNKILIQNDAILFASSHIRKNGGKRPTLEDMKGNSYLAYSAKVVIGIHNDMKLMKDKSKIFWKKKLSTGDIIKMPVLEAHFLKSKVSNFNSSINFLHEPSKGLVREPDQQTALLLKELIYSEM